MLDKYLKRKDVLDFINLIKINPKFHNKRLVEKNSFGKYLDKELALYIFYDAIFKYKVIIDDDSLFEGYFEQIQKLYRRIDSVDGVQYGIHKAICNSVCCKLDIGDVWNKENREKIIRYIYEKYILDGYFIHGFSTVYEKSIKDNGFLSEIYSNNYSEMDRVKRIFEKNGICNALNKDFSNNTTYFTDNFVMGCYYSINSPGYFYNLLYGNKFKNRLGYLNGNYKNEIRGLKRKIDCFNKNDYKYVLNVVRKEWDMLNSVPKKISLLLVKRSLINSNRVKIDDFLNMEENVYEVIDSMLNPKNNKIMFNDVLYDDINIVSLDDFYEISDVKKDNKIKVSYENLLNVYGVASVFIVIGAMAISLGVLFTIIMLGGM